MENWSIMFLKITWDFEWTFLMNISEWVYKSLSSSSENDIFSMLSM